VGASRNESYLTNDTATNPKSYTARVNVLQRLADGWDLQAHAAYSTYAYDAGVMLAGGANSADFQTNEIRFFGRRNQATFHYSSADWTINGKYRLFGRKLESLFGMVYYEPSNPVNFFPTDPTFAVDNVHNGVGFRAISNSILAVPMNNPQMDKIRTRQADAYESTYTTSARGIRSSQTQWTMFLQEKIDVLPDRLSLVGSISKFNFFNETESVFSPKPAVITASVQRQQGFPYGLGLVFYPMKSVAIYATQRTTLAVQTSRLIDGSVTPPALGKLREVGVKTDFQDGRYSTTFSVYENNLTNVSVGTGLISPFTGLTYSLLIGATNSRGIDLNLSFRPVPNWQMTFSANRGKVTDQYGRGGLPATNRGAWGGFTRYDFTSDALKRFAIGGGANRFYDRWIGASTMRLPDGTTPPGNGSPGSASAIKLKEDIWAMLFIHYKATRNLTLKVQVDNLFDVLIARGFQHASAIDIGEPRNVKLLVTYRF